MWICLAKGWVVLLDENRARNLDAGESQTIADLPSRTRCSDLALVGIAGLDVRSAYTSDAEDIETIMPDMPPAHRKRKAGKTPAAIEGISDVSEEELPPDNGGSDVQESVQADSMVAVQKSEKATFDGSPRNGGPTRKVTPSDMANMLLAENDFAVYQDQLYLYSAAEGYWFLLPESEANRKLRGIIPRDLVDIVNKNALIEIYEWLRIRADMVDSKAGEHRYLLNFRDCALDWRTMETIYDRKRLFFRYALQMRYNDLSEHSTGAYKRFLDDVFRKDEATMKEFRKFLGLCLSDIRTLKLCFFLYGPSNTGKSVVLNLLKRIVGADWCSSLSFTQMGNEFALTQLMGKRLNLSGEVSGASNKRLDIFKSLTGNDSITACFKGKDHFQFVNEALLVFACNDFPPVQTVTEFDSFLSRVVIFPFENVKARSEWIENLEDVLLEDAGAIIADAIKGLKRLDESDFQFKETPSMKAAKHEFVGRYNSFALFAEEHLERDANTITTSQEISSRYYQYCRDEDYPVLPDNMWSALLVREFACRKTTKTIDSANGSTRVRAYKGVRLLEPGDYIIPRRT